jgi:methyl-accepting chemotaxis protein
VAYREFWAKLNRGEFEAAQYKRLGKGGKEIWIQASYNPILDSSGKPVGVIKFAADITAQKIKSMEYAGKIDAIVRVQKASAELAA